MTQNVIIDDYLKTDADFGQTLQEQIDKSVKWNGLSISSFPVGS